MDRLWAPWRKEYIKNPTPAGDNFITRCDKETNDRQNLVILRTELSIVLLNRFPYNNGHLLVAPRREVADLAGLTDAEVLDCQKLLKDLVKALTELVQCQGFNVGLNLGRAAGAGLPQPLHWHIVPRWNGDTNFMTLIADSRVIIESLDEMWLQLRTHLKLPTK